jgi:antitoxin FitA
MASICDSGISPEPAHGAVHQKLGQRQAINLSIKNAPDDLVERLRERAAKNHRSLQGDLLAIIEEVVRPPARLMPSDVLAEARRLGLETPGDAVAIIRAAG